MDISPWTLVAWGGAWCAVSTVLALALGRVLGRTNAAAEAEQATLDVLQRAPLEAEGSDPWLSEVVDDEMADADNDYGSRATSGTRFRAVQVEEDLPERKIRRVR